MTLICKCLTSDRRAKVARDAHGAGGGQHFTVTRFVFVDAFERGDQFGHERGHHARYVHQGTLRFQFSNFKACVKSNAHIRRALSRCVSASLYASQRALSLALTGPRKRSDARHQPRASD